MAQMGISMMNDLFDNFEMQLESGATKIPMQEVKEMLQVAEDFHNSWAETFKKMNKIFVAIRRDEYQLDSPEEMERKMDQLLEEANKAMLVDGFELEEE